MITVATRSELLARRSAIRFASQGRDLIWDKRTALMREFQALQVNLLAQVEQLAGQAASARRALQEAQASEGPIVVASAALAAATGISVTLTERTVAGVRLLDADHTRVVRTPETRGWAPVLTGPRVDAAAAAYERYLEQLLDLCALELTVRRLATEIARATRQVNALENVVIPRWQAQARAIVVALDEREREDHARLARARGHRSTQGPGR